MTPAPGSENEPRDAAALLELFELHLESELDAGRAAELERAVLTDPRAMALYVRYMHQHATLERSVAGIAEAAAIAATALPTASTSRGRRFWGWAARLTAAAAIVLIAAELIGTMAMRTGRSAARREAPFATLADAEGVKWGPSDLPTQIGSALAGGTLRFGNGVVSIDFLNGARVRVEGPAELQLNSAKRAFLREGSLLAYVPKSAAGFTVAAPGLAVVDLGTEFGIRVGADRPTEMQVIKGRVQITRDGEKNQQFTAGEAAMIDAGGRLTRHPADPSRFAFAKPGDLANPAATAYRRVVLGDRPVGYWDAGELADDRVNNRVPGGPAAHILGYIVANPEGRGLSLAHGGLRVEEPIRLAENYTLEMWVKPTGSHRTATLLTLYTTVNRAMRVGGLVSLLSMQPGVKGRPPRSVRYLHRSPASFLPGRPAEDAYTDRPYELNRWNHIVAERDGQGMRLYLNGRLSGTSSPGNPLDIVPRLLIGVDPARDIPPDIACEIDDVAVYNRALTAEEIGRHWELGSARSRGAPVASRSTKGERK